MRRIVIDQIRKSKSKDIRNKFGNNQHGRLNEYGFHQFNFPRKQTIIDQEDKQKVFLKRSKNKLIKKTSSCSNFLVQLQNQMDINLNKKQFTLPLTQKEIKDNSQQKSDNINLKLSGNQDQSCINLFNLQNERAKEESLLFPSASQYKTQFSKNSQRRNKLKNLEYKMKPSTSNNKINQVKQQSKEMEIKKPGFQKILLAQSKKVQIQNPCKQSRENCQKCQAKNRQIRIVKELLARLLSQFRFIHEQHNKINKQIQIMKNQLSSTIQNLMNKQQVKTQDISEYEPQIISSKIKEENKIQEEDSQSSIIKIKINQFVEQLSNDISKIIDHNFLVENQPSQRAVGKIVKRKTIQKLTSQNFDNIERKYQKQIKIGESLARLLQDDMKFLKQIEQKLQMDRKDSNKYSSISNQG